MAVSLNDLPPRVRDQVAKKMLEEKKIATSAAPPRDDRGKYGNRKAVRVMADGRVLSFDSQKEARRYDELIVMLQAGVICDLRLQHEFALQEPFTTPDGFRVRAIRYRADFTYKTADGRFVVEDVKSRATKTKEYELKRKLMRERHGILIKEV